MESPANAGLSIRQDLRPDVFSGRKKLYKSCNALLHWYLSLSIVKHSEQTNKPDSYLTIPHPPAPLRYVL